MQSVSHNPVNASMGLLHATVMLFSLFPGGVGVDVEAAHRSGLIDTCCGIIAGFENRGQSRLSDTCNSSVYLALSILLHCSKHPEVTVKIRRVGRALEFCLNNDLDWFSEYHFSSALAAAKLCECLFAFHWYLVGAWKV